jgi:hypothetical protein
VEAERPPNSPTLCCAQCGVRARSGCDIPCRGAPHTGHASAFRVISAPQHAQKAATSFRTHLINASVESEPESSRSNCCSKVRSDRTHNPQLRRRRVSICHHLLRLSMMCSLPLFIGVGSARRLSHFLSNTLDCPHINPHISWVLAADQYGRSGVRSLFLQLAGRKWRRPGTRAHPLYGASPTAKTSPKSLVPFQVHGLETPC